MEDNLDPNKAGRVKIRVFGVYDDIPLDDIPWAEYADPLMGGQAGFGGIIVPDIDTKVWVFFEQGNHMYPVYFAGAPSHIDMPNEKDIGTYPTEPEHWNQREPAQYPYNRVYRTKSGHVIEIDDSPAQERIRISHRTGTQVIMFENGDLHELVVGDVERHVLGNVNEVIDGNFTRLIKGNSNETVEQDMGLVVHLNRSTHIGENYDEQIDGSMTTSIVKTRTEQSGDGSNYLSASDITINGTNVYIN